MIAVQPRINPGSPIPPAAQPSHPRCWRSRPGRDGGTGTTDLHGHGLVASSPCSLSLVPYPAAAVQDQCGRPGFAVGVLQVSLRSSLRDRLRRPCASLTQRQRPRPLGGSLTRTPAALPLTLTLGIPRRQRQERFSGASLARSAEAKAKSKPSPGQRKKQSAAATPPKRWRGAPAAGRGVSVLPGRRRLEEQAITPVGSPCALSSPRQMRRGCGNARDRIPACHADLQAASRAPWQNPL